MDYGKILLIAYPGHGWALRNTADFDTLFWEETNPTPKPSLEQALAKFEEMKGAEAMKLLRQKRNELLKSSDVYVLPDFPHPDEATRQAWLTYRQALRDITATSTPSLTEDYKLDEESVAWPLVPVKP